MRYFFFLLLKLISFKFGFYIGFTWDIRVLPRTAPSAVSTIGPSCPATSFKQTNDIRPTPHGGFVNDDFIYETEKTKILLDSIWNHIIEFLNIQGDPRNMTFENFFKVVFDIWNYLPHSFLTFILKVEFSFAIRVSNAIEFYLRAIASPCAQVNLIARYSSQFRPNFLRCVSIFFIKFNLNHMARKKCN